MKVQARGGGGEGDEWEESKVRGEARRAGGPLATVVRVPSQPLFVTLSPSQSPAPRSATPPGSTTAHYQCRSSYSLLLSIPRQLLPLHPGCQCGPRQASPDNYCITYGSAYTRRRPPPSIILPSVRISNLSVPQPLFSSSLHFGRGGFTSVTPSICKAHLPHCVPGTNAYIAKYPFPSPGQQRCTFGTICIF